MKRLICCLDGTWNNDQQPSRFTNVVRLHRAILPADQNGVEQVARYFHGIGHTETFEVDVHHIGMLFLWITRRLRSQARCRVRRLALREESLHVARVAEGATFVRRGASTPHN